jgi:hypothetical protein
MVESSWRFVLAGVAVAACAACGGGGNPQSSTTTTAAAVPASGDAIDVVAANRCEHEARCGNVGASRRYVNNEGCLMELRGHEMNELTSVSCPRGVDQLALDRCLADLRTAPCESTLDSFASLQRCMKDTLCPK